MAAVDFDEEEISRRGSVASVSSVGGLLIGGSSGGGLDGISGGVAGLAEQSGHERAFAPFPSPTGELVHDPDFALPTIAGSLPWRLFYYSSNPGVDGPFGYGRRASWPLRACVEQNPVGGSVLTVTLEREDGLGAVYASQDGGTSYLPRTQRTFDSLTGSPTAGFTETRLDSGSSFVYLPAYPASASTPPKCAITTLSYYQTVHGQTVTMQYDTGTGGTGGTGLLSAIEEPAGRTIDYTYFPPLTGDPNGTNGRVQAVTDWAGRIHTFSYDAGNLRAVQDPGGYVVTYGYDGQHHLQSIEDPNGFVTQFAYDGQNRVTSRNVDGRTGQYTYGGGSGGQTVQFEDPYGQFWNTTVDGQGNVLSVADPLGAIRTATYNSYGLPLVLTDAVGRLTTMAYDVGTGSGNTGRQTLHQEPGQLPNTFVPDAFGNVTQHADPLGRVTTYSYGSAPEQRLLQTGEDPLGQVTSYAYRPWGAMASVETPLGFITTYTWDDSHGVMTAEQNPLGGTRAYGYDAAGNRTRATDEMGRPMTFTFDGLGRQTSSENGVGAVRTSVWDGVGNLVAHVDPFGFATTYQYDALRNETVETDAHGFQFQTFYDLKGRETARQDANGNQTQSVWDVADRRIQRIDGVGHITTTQYDAARRVVGTMDSAGHVYQTVYDGFDAAGLSVVAQVSPSNHRTTSVYDAAGQLVATIDSAGHRTTYVYDAAGRLWSTQESTGARTTSVYDANGRTVGVVNALGYRSTSTYDVAGHLTQSMDSVNRIYTTSYDLSGLRLQESAPDGTWVLRHYDAAGRNHGTLDYRGYTTSTTYDTADRVTAFTDEYGKVVTDVYSPIGLVSMSYDTLGNISTTTYDPGRRPIVYADGAGNISTTSYDAANKVSLYLAGLDTSEAYHYDGFGRYQATETPLGERTSIAYDPFGRLAAQMDATSNATSLSYDGFGRWAATMDPLGAVVTTNFDVYGRPCGYTDELGYVTTFAMDLLDRPIAQIDALGFATSYVFDAVGRTVGRQDAQGARTTSVYDGRGNLLATENALGQLTTFGYDQYSRRVSTENALGFVSTTIYDNYGRFWASEDARGNRSTTVYDPWSRFWASENARGERTTTVYDYYGRTWASIDPLGYRTTTGYDQLSRVTGRMDADGFITTTVYDPVGRPWATMDPLGYRTSTAYDAAGRVLGTMDALGFISTNVFDGVGRTVANIDARGYRTSYAYDLKGQQVASMDALGFVHTSVYDALGRSTASVDPLGYRTTMFYDSVGRVSARQDQLGYLTSSTYDLLGRTVATTDALNRLTTFAFDAAGRTVATQDAAGVFMTTTYDSVGNRLAWQNGLGYLTSYSYDALNRKTAWMDPLGRAHTLVFDAAGRLHTETDALGQVTTHGYAPNGWEVARSFADGQQFSFSYDKRGSQLTAFDTTGLTTHTYDAVGRLKTVLGPDYPNAQALTYAYDGMGNRVGLAGYFADGSGGYSGVFTYAYDGRGQLATLADPGYPPQSIAGGVTSFGYDALGRQSFQQNGNATGSTFAYDAVGRTLQVWHASLSSGAAIDRAFYGYDAAGRPQWMESAAARHTYTYDAVDQLLSEQVSLFGSGGGSLVTTTFDAVGDFRVDASATSASGAWQYGSRASLSTSSPFALSPITTSQYDGTLDLAGYITPGIVQPMLLGNLTTPPTTITYLGYPVPADNLLLHPGSSGQYAVLRFVAPALGLYHFSGVWQGILNGATTDVHVRRVTPSGTPGDTLFARSVNDNFAPHPFDLAGVSLSLGEIVEFLVGWGDNQYYGSDSTGLAVSVTFAPLPTQVTTYTYDAAGRRATKQEQALTDGSPASPATPAFLTGYAYDAADQLLTTQVAGGTGGVGAMVTTFTYDANGARLSSEALGGAVTTYTWDAANRLATVTTPTASNGLPHTFTYDSAGMRHGHTAPSGSVDNLLWDPASGAPLLWADPVQLVSVIIEPGPPIVIGPPGVIGGGEGGGGDVGSSGSEGGGGESPASSATVGIGTGPGASSPSASAPSASSPSASADDDEGGTTSTASAPLSELFVQTPDAARTLRSLGQSRQSVPIARQFHLDAMGTTEAQTAGAIGAGSDSGTGAGIAEFTFDAFGNGLSTSPLPTPLPLTNADFETPPLGIGTGPGNSANYVYDPTGSGVGWSFTSYGAGIAGNGSNFTYDNPGAPSGTQVAFLQGAGAVQQAVTVPGAGMLSVSFFAAQRGSPTNLDDPNPPPSSQAVRVSLIDSGGNGQTLATVTPAGIAYQQVVTTPVAVSAVGGGTYTLQFLGLDPQGGDNSAFLDRVEATFTATPGAGSDDGTGANPLAWLGGLGYWQGEAGGTGGAGGSGSSDGGVGLSYVRARWLDNETGQWMSVDPVEGEPRYSYARNSPTMGVDPQGTDPTSIQKVQEGTVELYADNGQPTAEEYEIRVIGTSGRGNFNVAGRGKNRTAAFADLLSTWGWLLGGNLQSLIYGNGNAPTDFAHSLQALQEIYQGANLGINRGHALWGAHGSSLPLWWINFAPPADMLSEDGLKYAAGFIAGIAESLANLIPIVGILGLAKDCVRFATYMFAKRGAGNLIDFLSSDLAPLLSLFTSDQDLSPFERGFALGGVIGGAICTIILIAGTIEFVGAGGIAEGVEQASSLMSSLSKIKTWRLPELPRLRLPNLSRLLGIDIVPVSLRDGTIILTAPPRAEDFELVRMMRTITNRLGPNHTTDPVELQRMTNDWQRILVDRFARGVPPEFTAAIMDARTGDYKKLNFLLRKRFFDRALENGFFSDIKNSIAKDPVTNKTDVITVEHIVALSTIAKMDSFLDLNPDQMASLVTDRENLTALGNSINSSKQDSTWSDWYAKNRNREDITPQGRLFIESLIVKENQLRPRLQAKIDLFISENRKNDK